MGNILGYFDLNKRLAKPSSTEAFPQGSSIDPGTSHTFAAPPKSAKTIPVWRQVTLYLATVVGVLFSSAVLQFQSSKPITLNITITTVILSSIIALVIIPNIYDKVVKQDAPLLVQIGLFVQQGVFWSVLLTSIGKVFG